MAKYIMVAQARPTDGREDAFNEWYDTVHLADILALPGVKSGRRFDFAEARFGGPGQPCLALYEIEADDLSELLAALERRAASGEGTAGAAGLIEPTSSALWFYKQRE